MGNKHAHQKAPLSSPTPPIAKKGNESNSTPKLNTSVQQSQLNIQKKILDTSSKLNPTSSAELPPSKKDCQQNIPKNSVQHEHPNLQEQKKQKNLNKQEDWQISFACSLEAKKCGKIKIRESNYEWVIFGVIHSSCKFQHPSQLWDQKCVFFNLGSLNLWAFGSKIESLGTSQHLAEVYSEVTLICNLQERKLIWRSEKNKLSQLYLPKEELDNAGSWKFFYCAYRGNAVQWME